MSFLRVTAAALAVSAFFTFPAQAQHHHHASGGSAQAEASFGKWSFFYHFMHMRMNGFRDGTNDISVSELAVNRGFEMVPLDMDMGMHMFGAGYQATDWLNVSLSTHFEKKKMDMLHFSGHVHHSPHQTKGWGDTVAAADIMATENIHVRLGVSLPTGSIDEAGVHGDNTVRHAYDMQHGTGTYDLLPGVTYLTQSGAYDFGVSISGRVHMGENDHDYTWGNKAEIAGWAGYQIFPWLHVQGGLKGEASGAIKGTDPAVTLDMPNGIADNYGGTIAEATIGFDLTPMPTPGSQHRISAQFTLPVYQDLNGPQMKRDWGFILGWTGRF